MVEIRENILENFSYSVLQTTTTTTTTKNKT